MFICANSIELIEELSSKPTELFLLVKKDVLNELETLCYGLGLDRFCKMLTGGMGLNCVVY